MPKYGGLADFSTTCFPTLRACMHVHYCFCLKFTHGRLLITQFTIEFLAIVYNIIDHQEAFLKGYFSIHENSGRDYSHLLPNFLMFTHGKVSFLVSLFFRASGLSGPLQSLLTI